MKESLSERHISLEISTCLQNDIEVSFFLGELNLRNNMFTEILLSFRSNNPYFREIPRKEQREEETSSSCFVEAKDTGKT